MNKFLLTTALALTALSANAANGSWTKVLINGSQTMWGISYTLPINASQTTPAFATSNLPGAELTFLVRPVSGTLTTSASIWGQMVGSRGTAVGPSATIIGTYGVGTGQFGGSVTQIIQNQVPLYGLTVTVPSPSTQIDIFALERTPPAAPQYQINP